MSCKCCVKLWIAENIPELVRVAYVGCTVVCLGGFKLAPACSWMMFYSMLLAFALVSSVHSDSVTVEDYLCVASGLSAC